MRIAVLDAITKDLKLRNQWNDLVLRSEDPQVFYTYEWSLAVERAYSAILRPLVVVLYDESECLAGVVSLALNPETNAVSFLCANTGDYCDFVSLPERKTSFVCSVLNHLRDRRTTQITLTNLPADSTTVVALEQNSRAAGYHFFARTAYICAQVCLGRIERRAGGKLELPGRKMVRRSLSSLGRESPVSLDHARTYDAIAAHLPEFMQAHIARFEATGRVSNLARPERQLFLLELAKLLADEGWVVLTRMVAGDRTLAWNYGFRFQGSLFWYQPTFDTTLEQYSPGFCMLSMLIEEASGDPELRLVDLGLGAEGYKERFANQNRRTVYVTLRSSLTMHLTEVLRYRIAQFIKFFPRLERLLRQLIWQRKPSRVTHEI